MFRFLKTKAGFMYLLLQPISTALEVGLAYVLMLAIDYATGGNIEQLHIYLLGFLIYLAITFVVDTLTRRFQEKASTLAVMSLRESLMSKILKMQTSEYAKKNSGAYVAYMTKHVERIDYSFFYKFFELYPQILQFVVAVVWLFILDWRLGLFVMATGSVQILVPKFFVTPTGKAQKDFVDANEKYTITIKEIFEAFDLVKSYNLQEKIELIHKNANTQVGKKDFHSNFLDGFTGIVSNVLSNITYIGVFFLGAVLVLLGYFKISVIIAASQLVVFIIYPLGMLTQTITSLLAAKEIMKDLNQILNAESSTTPTTKKKSFDSEIALSNVNFAYPADEDDDEDDEDFDDEYDSEENAEDESNSDETQLALSDVSLRIKKGEKILIVGESGSGKSTLLSLLYKKFTDYEGSIEIDGVNIQNISDEDYFNLVSVIHQSPFIFDDTIKNNIALYNDDFTDEDIAKAVKKAGLEKFINSLPQKYETKIGEGASRISGGQKQRIAIARALIKNTPILLMDEATSALDSETANDIENIILSEPEKTCIIISHHVGDSLKQKADRIITVADGKLV